MENVFEITEIKDFRSAWEFEKFQHYIAWLIAEDVLEETEKGQSSLTQFYGIYEVWYTDREDQIWVLVAPDFPSKGFFLKLQDIH